MQKIEILHSDITNDGHRQLGDYFDEHYPQISFSLLNLWLRKGEVRLNGQKTHRKAQITAGDTIRLPPPHFFPTLSETPTNLTAHQAWQLLDPLIIQKEQDFIIIDKPAGLAVQGGSNLKNYLDLWLQAINKERPYHQALSLVHRLDRATSGLLVIAKSRASAEKFAELFRSRHIEKIYWAIVASLPNQQRAGVIDAPIGPDYHQGFEKQMIRPDGQPAITEWQVLNDYENSYLLSINPQSGRKHQIRVHLAHLGAPIIGDNKYGGAPRPPTDASCQKSLFHTG